MNIALIVTGSIAAYKSAELVRELAKRGHSVQVVMSAGAQRFITPLTLQTLSNRRVATDLWSLEEENSIGHIRIADEADLVLVAPASANFIAKAALGGCEDISQTVFLASKAAKLICPAMNVNMWENAATQQNIELLKQRGIHILEPASGELACGWVGAGRLPEVSVIVDAAEKTIRKPLIGQTIVVTAGPTREAIDPMRVISNLSSGKTGSQIAMRATELGAKVVFLAGPGVQTDLPNIGFESALELQEKLQTVLRAVHQETTLIMAAAPADFRPESPSVSKSNLPKDEAFTLRLIPNPDILLEIGEQRGDFPLLKAVVAFAAEDATGMVDRAQIKLRRKKADFIVANDVQKVVNREETEFFLLSKEGRLVNSGPLHKREAAHWLLQQLFGF